MNGQTYFRTKVVFLFVLDHNNIFIFKSEAKLVPDKLDFIFAPNLWRLQKSNSGNNLLRWRLGKSIKSNRGSQTGNVLLVFHPSPHKANRRNCLWIGSIMSTW